MDWGDFDNDIAVLGHEEDEIDEQEETAARETDKRASGSDSTRKPLRDAEAAAFVEEHDAMEDISPAPPTPHPGFAADV